MKADAEKLYKSGYMMDIRSTSWDSVHTHLTGGCMSLSARLPLLLTLTHVMAGSCTNMCKA